MPHAPTEAEHREAVERFMAMRQAQDPELVAAVLARYPVLSTAQVVEAQHRESHLSDAMLAAIPVDAKDRRIPTDSEPGRANRGTGKPTGRPRGDPVAQAERKRLYNRARYRQQKSVKNPAPISGGHK